MFTPETVDLVFARDNGRCAKCGRRWNRYSRRGELGGWDMQHRQARGQGGARRNAAIGNVANAVILCRGCHDWVEKVCRALGFAHGFAISRNGIQKPWDVAIKHAVHGWCRLTQDGGIERANGPAD